MLYNIYIKKGEYTWPSLSESYETVPLPGCNGDRMTHIAKGIMGIRMDGVEHAIFSNIEISNIHELSELGKEVCTEYWDGNFKIFDGKGHFLQNTPYLYGYTGNMAHGIYTDWSIFTLTDNIKIRDIYSTTGLVRGIGLYTSSNVILSDVNLEMYNLAAGITLYDIDTNELSHPYSPTIAKPFHVVAEWEYNDDNTFYSYVTWDDNVDISQVTFSCILGRDGEINDLVFMDYNDDHTNQIDIDNTYEKCIFDDTEFNNKFNKDIQQLYTLNNKYKKSSKLLPKLIYISPTETKSIFNKKFNISTNNNYSPLTWFVITINIIMLLSIITYLLKYKCNSNNNKLETTISDEYTALINRT